MEWKKINDNYSVSECGDVRNDRNNHILKPELHYKGYYRVTINGKHQFIHRLVCIAYHDNPNNYEQVNHKDGIKTNNCKDNVEWCNNQLNMHHAALNGLAKYSIGEGHCNVKLTQEQAYDIKYSGDRAKELAERYNVAVITIYHIKDGTMWKHI